MLQRNHGCRNLNLSLNILNLGEGCLRSKIQRPTHFLDIKANKEVIRPAAIKVGNKSGELKTKWGTKN